MDVKEGHCWRCEAPGTNVSCKKCNKAKYCRDKCRNADKDRHKPQCEVWTPAVCSNPRCTISENLKECASCCNARYCGFTCQRQHWSQHKQTCRQTLERIKEVYPALGGHFYSHMGTARNILGLPYYIGNAITVDMLRIQTNELLDASIDSEKVLRQDYNILSAACGNLRNMIYTITSLPEEFLGNLRVTLNDIDPFIQARNVLFLFMMMHYSEDPDIASKITTIWYSLHLPKDTYRRLMECLEKLCTINGSTLKKSTHGMVYVSDDDLDILRQVWQGWIKLDQQQPTWRVVSLSQQRSQMFKDDPGSSGGLETFKAQIPKRYRKSAESWVYNGDFVPSGGTIIDQRENPTLTGRMEKGAGAGISYCAHTHKNILDKSKKLPPKDAEFVYCVPSDLMPFGAWDYLQACKFSTDDSLLVMFHAYITDQIHHAISFASQGRLNICIDLGSCLEISSDNQIKGGKFDRIFTSNVADYVGTKTLLDALKPLLNTMNKNAVIVTQYWNWYDFFPLSKVNDMTYLFDGRQQKWIDSARKDTGVNPKIQSRHWCQEYFNNSSYFIDYLRADLKASRCNLGLDTAKETIPTFQEVKCNDGLRMRDFRHELNKVAPWRYRCNARSVNMLPGFSRNLEWYIP